MKMNVLEKLKSTSHLFLQGYEVSLKALMLSLKGLNTEQV